MKEWEGLWDQEVFDFTTTREYDDVVARSQEERRESPHGSRTRTYL